MNLKRISQMLYLLFLLILINSGCKKEDELVKSRGQLVSHRYLAKYKASDITTYATLANVTYNPIETFDVSIEKIVYNTIDYNGNIVTATGAIFIPDTDDQIPVTSFYHGTQTNKSEVVSNRGIFVSEGMVGLLLAGMGFLAVIPDYTGLGESNMLHPYLISDLSAAANIDMLLAAKQYCTENNINITNNLYIGGYSEGGYITLVTQAEIEKNYASQFTLKASAPMAGPSDLVFTTNQIFAADSFLLPAGAAFMALSYNTKYKIAAIDDIFKAPYNAQIEDLFNVSKSVSEIDNVLPLKISELFNSQFINTQFNNKSSQFWQAVSENTTLNFSPQAPILLVHGSIDEIVPYQNSVNAYNYFKSKGTEVTFETIENGMHVNTGLPAINKMINWFYQLKSE